MDTEFEALVKPLKTETMLLPEWMYQGDRELVIDRLLVNEDSLHEFLSSRIPHTFTDRMANVSESMANLQALKNFAPVKLTLLRKLQNFINGANEPTLQDKVNVAVKDLTEKFDLVLNDEAVNQTQYENAKAICADLLEKLALRGNSEDVRSLVWVTMLGFEQSLIFSKSVLERLSQTEARIAYLKEDLQLQFFAVNHSAR